MRETSLEITMVPVSELVPYENNAKIHTEAQLRHIANSIEQYGFNDPIGIWHNEEGIPEIVTGHGALMAAASLGYDEVPCTYLDHLTDEERRIYCHIHNQTQLETGLDYDALVSDMDNLNADWGAFGFDEYLYNADAVIDEPSPEELRKTLRERFGFVPFSVIRTTTAEWTGRKKKWLGLGIRSELGRGGDLLSMAGCQTRHRAYGRRGE